MPLEKSASPGAFKRNVSTLMGEVGKSPHVQSREQALAIAYATQRRGKQAGGRADPTLRARSDPELSVHHGFPTRTDPKIVIDPEEETVIGTPLYPRIQSEDYNVINPEVRIEGKKKIPGLAVGGAPDIVQELGGRGVDTADRSIEINPDKRNLRRGQHISPFAVRDPMVIDPENAYEWKQEQPIYPAPYRETPSSPAPSFQAGGSFASHVPWFARREATHMGALHSNVPGRTDHLPITVGGGAYVLPADHISSMGQNNTQAGQKIASQMFKSGPWGTAAPALHHGPGAPRPPGLPKMPSVAKVSTKVPNLGAAAGGVHDGQAKPVDILAAGGEHVLPPEAVRAYARDLKSRHPEWANYDDMELAHHFLDHWVVRRRKKHIDTLKGLPGPAKK